MLFCSKRELRALEWALIIVSIALAFLAYRFSGNKMVILNLFFLPVVLSGFYLGRYHAGVLALLCVIATSMVAAVQLEQFGAGSTPLAAGLSVVVWGAVLSLTAILVGTLSDERQAQAQELHEAYVGVVEVLSSYLQGGNPHWRAMTARVVELCQQVAGELRLPTRQMDDIRVAALMQDLGKIEITTRVISKAVDSLSGKAVKSEHYSFQGTDLVHSLGGVLRGAIPILLSQETFWPSALADEQVRPDRPIGAEIVRVVRAYCSLTVGALPGEGSSPAEALAEMRRDRQAEYHQDVLEALERICVAQRPVAV